MRAAYERAAFPAPSGSGLTVSPRSRATTMSTAASCTAACAGLLERSLLAKPAIAAEMGRAMLRLAQAQLGAGDIDAAEHEAVLSWLHGDLRSISVLRSALIYSRIGRHNARSMFTSTAALLLAAG